MGEIHNDNPETKSSSPEISQPAPVKASGNDKEKLVPHENDSGKLNKENNEKNDTTDKPGKISNSRIKTNRRQFGGLTFKNGVRK